MRKFAIAAIILGASPVHAQTTNCRWLGNVWTCDTQERHKPVDMMGTLRAAQGLVPDYQQEEARRAQADQARAVADQLRDERRERERMQALRMKVGDLVGKGDCDGARKIALEAGEFGLAGEVKQYCNP